MTVTQSQAFAASYPAHVVRAEMENQNDKKIRGAIFILFAASLCFRPSIDGATKIAGASSKPRLRRPSPRSPAAASVQHADRSRQLSAPSTSLLRGGFSSVNEFFERVHDDPVLHDFYGDCADRNASMHALPEDIATFSTFRKGDKIKWAQKPLLIKKGEYVMTFCGKTVLARCGNLISVSPMQPSEDVPPAMLEAPEDRAGAPLILSASSDVGGGAPPLPPIPPAPISPVAAAVVPAAHHPFWFIPPFYVPQGSSHGGPTLPTSPGIIVPSMPGQPRSAPPPPPGGPLSGDEFSGHGAFITLFVGMFVIALLKLTTR